VTDAPPIIIDEDAAIDSAFFGSHAGRSCYARDHRSGWVLVVRQVQREPPVMVRVWGRVERVPDDDVSCLALWERCAYPRWRPHCRIPQQDDHTNATIADSPVWLSTKVEPIL
jgi:hypothetical protein